MQIKVIGIICVPGVFHERNEWTYCHRPVVRILWAGPCAGGRSYPTAWNKWRHHRDRQWPRLCVQTARKASAGTSCATCEVPVTDACGSDRIAEHDAGCRHWSGSRTTLCVPFWNSTGRWFWNCRFCWTWASPGTRWRRSALPSVDAESLDGSHLQRQFQSRTRTQLFQQRLERWKRRRWRLERWKPSR